MVKKFRLKTDSTLNDAKAGTVVYALSRHDYGLASDDTRLTGVEHVSVTLDPAGYGQSFTHPKRELDPLN